MLSIAERHKYILDSLNKHGFVRITDVANELGVTKVTIRKDIKILESKGLLYKVHGSARPANPHVADLDVHVKDNINRDAKRRIAVEQRAAAREIEDSRRNADVEERQLMAEAEQRAGEETEKILAKARTECEKMQSAARANLERAAQWIAEEVVNDKWQS